MNWNAKWIWSDGSQRKNQWICFRKRFSLEKEFDNAVLRITADSRYQLYINGRELTMGPARNWPFTQDYDVIPLKDFLRHGENMLAVLVNFYGESTSQYVHGRGGLLAQLDLLKAGEAVGQVVTDQTWLWARHASYTGELCRINVAQPWIEVFDAARFDQDWMQPEFDDTGWTSAMLVGEPGCEPWTSLQERSVPLFSRKEAYAEKIMSYEAVERQGVHACVNIRDNFFPGSTDSVDKGFLGYLATVIDSPCENRGTIELICRKSPETLERMKLNGKEIFFPETENTQEIILKQGKNFLLIDISGYHQRFNMNYYFNCESPITLESPLGGGESFVTVGPFQAGNVLNIVAIDNPLDFENETYKAVWKTDTLEELQKFSHWLKPVATDHCMTENPHILTMTDRVAEKKSVTAAMGQMLLPNLHSYLLEADGRDGRITVDFGKEISGFLEFDVDAPEGVEIDVDFAECCWKHNMEFSQDMNSGFRYRTREGRQTYRSHLRRGFRYAILTFRNRTAPVEIHLIRATELSYSILPQGSFQCSDWELNKIWEISSRSVALCMEDTYVDCPAFEQAYWIGDARIEALVNNYTYGAYELTRRSIGMVGGSLTKSELPEAQVPTGCNTVLTAWILLWLLSCKEYYEYSGDLNGLRAVYPAMSASVDRLETYLNQDGLLEIDGWNMLDWAGMDTPVSGVVTHQNALLVKVLREMAQAAELLGDAQRAEKLEKVAESIRQAMNRILWNPERNAFIDCIHHDGSLSQVISIQTNIMAYLCGCVEGDREKLLVDYILDPPADFVQIGSPFMSFFYYEALEKVGGYQKLLDSIRKKWGEMLRFGATTCWETFLGFEAHRLTRSHCHGWSAAPGYFLPRTILGVKPLSPGFQKFVVTPQSCGLSWARGEVPTPYGTIAVEWKYENGQITVECTAPEECEYTVLLPEN